MQKQWRDGGWQVGGFVHDVHRPGKYKNKVFLGGPSRSVVGQHKMSTRPESGSSQAVGDFLQF